MVITMAKKCTGIVPGSFSQKVQFACTIRKDDGHIKVYQAAVVYRVSLGCTDPVRIVANRTWGIFLANMFLM